MITSCSILAFENTVSVGKFKFISPSSHDLVILEKEAVFWYPIYPVYAVSRNSGDQSII